jgi:hypothetical protein
MALIHGPTTSGGSTHCDPTLSPSAGSQQHYQPAPSCRPPSPAGCLSILVHQLALPGAEMLPLGHKLLQHHAILLHPYSHFLTSAPAITPHRYFRPCQIPIAATRGPRFSTIEFLRRLLPALPRDTPADGAAETSFLCVVHANAIGISSVSAILGTPKCRSIDPRRRCAADHLINADKALVSPSCLKGTHA